MPISTANISAEAVKDHPPVGHIFSVYPDAVTPIMLAVDALLIALRASIMAEHELNHVDLWDPACRMWRDDADAMQALVDKRILSIRALSVMLPSDRPLLRMSMLISIMLRTTSPSHLVQAKGLLTRFHMLFACTDTDSVAVRVNALLRRGCTLIDSLLALPSVSESDGVFDLGSDFDADLPESHDMSGLVDTF